MRTLSWPDDPLYSVVIRTDYTDDGAWARVRSLIESPVMVNVGGHAVGPFRAGVEIVDDASFDQLTVEQLLALAGPNPSHPVAFLVDSQTLSTTDYPILVVDLAEERGRTFRVIPSELWNVQNNLAVANASWEDYAGYAGPDGVFRGLPQ